MRNADVRRTSLKKYLLIFIISGIVTILLFGFCFSLRAQAAPAITIDLDSGTTGEGSFGPLEMLFLMAILALAPSILIMMTSFTRIVIVLSFLRSALGTQQSPPNQVLIGLALFLTLFIMQPVLQQINEDAYTPYKQGLIDQQTAVENAVKPMKQFMLRQTKQKDLSLFLSISGEEEDLEQMEAQSEDQTMENLEKLSLSVIVPAFVTSELTRAFTIGFLLFIPFLIIDMVVSSTLMSMGMVMLPPSMIALPFKIMMFVLVDGWNLLLGTLAQGFR
ncbi:flagellar type III secretion system pore protein FliP [Marasmitruncus massiliensis]|uniref:flagellar type III secretion system pore protein FliP n=1 Tax=Marasmitruncus massiliensis TaxID=1944642 RepID=UPI000C7D5875|nr:flagellar type III secretion system pore protein FliP [Marasmitruncus massiliensis]